jgi:hypothetical protein
MVWRGSSYPASFLAARACVVALASVSCGGVAAAPQAPVTAVAPRATAAAPPPAPDVSQVADPPELALVGRLARPNASLAVIHGWSQLPFVQADQITELLVGDALGPLVDLDAPIDFAVSVQGEGTGIRGLLAVSAGVRDAAAAKAALGEKYTLVPGANGALLIQGLGHGQPPRDGNDDGPDDAASDRTCELMPAYGVPSTRLVCAEDPKALGELAPWLTRTAPRATAAADLSVDVRMAPLRPTLVAFRRVAAMLVGGLLGGSLSQGDHEAAVTLATDLLDFAVDLEGATFEVDLSDPLANAKATLRFSGKTSPLTRLALAHPDGGSAAPEIFWKLPIDSDLAIFERGIDATDLAKGARLAAQLFDKVLADVGLGGADRKAVLDAVAKVPSSAPLAYASGVDSDAVDAAARWVADGSSTKDSARAVAQSLLGWRLMELDEPPARIQGALRDVASAWARPGVAAAYATHSKGVAPPAIRTSPLPKGASVPKGSVHYAIDIPLLGEKAAVSGKKGKADAPLTVHVLVVPDGARTWVAVGGDPTLLASKVATAVGASASARPELAPLDAEKVGAAGFFDVRSLPEAVVQLSLLGGEPAAGALSALQSVGTLPHRGLAPIVFTLTAQNESTAAAALHVPRAAIEDAIVFALSHVQP